MPLDSMGRPRQPMLPWELHRSLAEWNILQSHILPLLACHAHDDPEVCSFPPLSHVCIYMCVHKYACTHILAYMGKWSDLIDEIHLYTCTCMHTHLIFEFWTQVLYESMVVMFLMTQLPPAPKIELDDEKKQKDRKQKTYGAALLPSFEGLVLFKEQLASSKNVLTVCVKCVCSVFFCNVSCYGYECLLFVNKNISIFFVLF